MGVGWRPPFLRVRNSPPDCVISICMKHIVPVGVCVLALITLGPLTYYTVLALVKAIPALGLLGVTAFAAAALDAAKGNA